MCASNPALALLLGSGEGCALACHDRGFAVLASRVLQAHMLDHGKLGGLVTCPEY